MPSSLVLSVLAHGLVAAVLYFACTHLPRIQNSNSAEHYAIRQLDLRGLDPAFPELPAEAGRTIPYPHIGPRSSACDLPAGLAEAIRSFPLSADGRQTLIQSDVRTHLLFAERVPMPTIILWTPGQMPRKRIVAPQPIPDTSSYVTPSLELPNQEIQLSSLAVRSTEQSSRNDSVPASTTSPVESSMVKPLQRPLVTVSQGLDPPTPATVLSFNDINMEEGRLLLPPVNDIAKSTSPASTRPLGTGDGSGSRKGSGETGAARADAESLADSEIITTDGRRLSATHILVSRDGRFKFVLVGNSLTDDYPATAELWANRMAYTAYLNVGLKQNWILQYSLTRSAELAAASNMYRVDAPWPYDIMRPNLLSRDLKAGTLMAHGVLDQRGHFESIAIVFPSTFENAAFVLHMLGQWRFRPARQNGQAIPVEVLLIIPDGLDD